MEIVKGGLKFKDDMSENRTHLLLLVMCCSLLSAQHVVALPAVMERIAALAQQYLIRVSARLPESMQAMILQKIKDAPKKAVESIFKSKIEEQKKEIEKKKPL